MEPLSDLEAIQRLALAMVVGAVLGIERERLDRPAGLRTYMLVVEGACLFMMCAILLAEQINRAGGVSDPGRIGRDACCLGRARAYRAPVSQQQVGPRPGVFIVRLRLQSPHSSAQPLDLQRL
jgi:hypothetical protein